MGRLGLKWGLVLGVCLFATTFACANPTPSVRSTFRHVSNADGVRVSFEVSALVEFPEGSPTAQVFYKMREATGAVTELQTQVPVADLKRARSFINRNWVGVAMPNGGVLRAKPARALILQIDDTVEVGAEVEYEDAVPEAGLERRRERVTAFVPVRNLRTWRALHAGDVALYQQRYLMGVQPLLQPSGNAPATWKATPVVIVNERKVNGATSYLVAERRDFTDPTREVARLYWVPKNRIRVPTSDEEFEAGLAEPSSSKVLRWLRQKVWFPWTHSILRFGQEEIAANAPEEIRFERRAKLVLNAVASEVTRDEVDEDAAHDAISPLKHSCAKYLYDERSDDD